MKMKTKASKKEIAARAERIVRLANTKLVLHDLDIEYTERTNGDLWFKCPTPTHKENDASTHMQSTPSDEYHNVWSCFGCQANGNIIHLVQLHTQLGFWESVHWLEARLGEEAEIEKKPKLYPKLPKYFEKPEKASDWHPAYFNYLVRRGITWGQIVKHNIGYVNKGRYKWRVIVPVMRKHQFATWIGRAVRKGQRLTSCPGGRVGLFNSEHSHPTNGPAILVEGWTDALKLERLGYNNVMALQTNQLFEEQFELLKTFPYIIVMPDNDQGGTFFINNLAPYINRHEFYIAQLTTEKVDPDKADDDEVIYAMENLMEWEPKIITPEIEIYL
jgi:DNA primase